MALMESKQPDDAEEEALPGEPEPWEAWETHLVLRCLILGAAGLAFLGWLIDSYILS